MRTSHGLCFCLAIFLARPAGAVEEVAVRVSTAFTGESGLYATGASRDLVQAEIGYAHRLRAFSRLEVWGEGSYTVGQRRDQLYGHLDSGLVAHQITAGARLALPVYRWLVPEVRLGVGALVGTMDLTLGARNAASTAGAFTGYALGGVELLLPDLSRRPHRRLVTAGLVAEAGYQLATPLRFSVAPIDQGNVVPMPQVATPLGSLSLSGALVRVGLLMRF
jgi:hypothetical protein